MNDLVTTFTITAPISSYKALALKYGWRPKMIIIFDEEIGEVETPTDLNEEGLTYVTYIKRYVQDKVLSAWLAHEIVYFKQAELQAIEDMKKQVTEQAVIAAGQMVGLVEEVL